MLSQSTLRKSRIRDGAGDQSAKPLVFWTASGNLVVHAVCGCIRVAGETTVQCGMHKTVARVREAEAVALGALMVQMERA
jgi:hypothetical protein